MVTILEIARAIPGADTWFIGFEQDLVDQDQIEHAMLELQVPGHVSLVARHLDSDAGRARFAEAVQRATAPGDRPRLVACFEAKGRAHNVEGALPSFTTSPHVLATLVVEPFGGEYQAAVNRPPAGCDGQVTFDPVRAERGLWPAIDPRGTISGRYPTDRHENLAHRCRQLLMTYQKADPDLDLSPLTPGAPGELIAAQALIRWLVQPYQVAEPFSSMPGERSSYDELLRTISGLVAGR
jgi:hypothetical protein